MQHRRYKSLNIISSFTPLNTHLLVEGRGSYAGNLYAADAKIIKKSINKAFSWSTKHINAFNFKICYPDWSNDIIYWMTTIGVIREQDLTDDSVDNSGGTGDLSIDVFGNGGNIYKIFTLENANVIIHIYTRIAINNWAVTVNNADMGALGERTYDASQVTIDGTYAYFLWKWSDENVELWRWTIDGAGATVIEIEDCGANTELPPINQRAIAYDGSDVLSFILQDTGDSKYYFYTYEIGSDTLTKRAEFNIALMLDRNNAATVPNELEKAFGISNEIIYEIKTGRGGIVQLQDVSALSDANIVVITDNFLMNSDGDMFEFTDVANEISFIRYTDGIMGIQKRGSFSTHPDFHINWNQEDSIKIYDNNDVLEFWGKITDKDRNDRGIYVYKIDSFTNEIYRKTYNKSYSGDDLDTKQKDLIDKACDFCYRSSSIVGTTQTFDYVYNRALIYLFWFGRRFERQVPYIEPDGKIWTKAYNGLVATGKSWDINDNSQEVFLIDVPGVEEGIQGFFKGNTGITRNTIRYKNNTTTIRPVAATRDPIEQLTGILPLNEFRDPKIEALTEANQLGDNRYNIWSMDTIFLGLRIKGEGYLPPGKTIQIQNTGQITIAQDDFLILSFKRDPKNDVYVNMILSDNIIFPKEFTNLDNSTPQQTHTASVQVLENQAAIAAGGGVHPDHNNLNGLNAGDVYEHISQAQKNALHSDVIKTVVNVEDVITAELVNGQSIDNAIDGLILTHKNINNAHHSLVTVNAPIVLTGQDIELKNDLGAQITEFDTHPLTPSDTKVPTNTTVIDYVGLRLLISEIDDAPVNGVTVAPISSNWAFDHAASPADVRHLTDVQVAALHAELTLGTVHTYIEANALTLEQNLSLVHGKSVDGLIIHDIPANTAGAIAAHAGDDDAHHPNVGDTIYEHITVLPSDPALLVGGFLDLDGDLDQYIRCYFQCKGHVDTTADIIFHLLNTPFDTDATVDMKKYAGASAPGEAFSFTNIENGVAYTENWTNAQLKDSTYTFVNANINAEDLLVFGWRVMENDRETRFVCAIVEYIWKEI